jgi:hypothetical protein
MGLSLHKDLALMMRISAVFELQQKLKKRDADLRRAEDTIAGLQSHHHDLHLRVMELQATEHFARETALWLQRRSKHTAGRRCVSRTACVVTGGVGLRALPELLREQEQSLLNKLTHLKTHHGVNLVRFLRGGVP